MFTKVEILDMSDVHKNTLDAHLKKYKYATVFHTQEWMKTLYEAHGYEPKYLAGMNDDDSFSALLPFMVDTRFGIRNYLSMPYDTYGGVIGDEDHLTLSYEFLKLPGFGIRYYVDYSGVHEGDLVATEILNMPKEQDINFIWDDVIRKTNRTAIKSAWKNNIVIREVTESVTIFDKVPQLLVDSIVRNMVSSGLAKIYLAYAGEEIVAASIFFVYGDMMMYWANTTTALGRKTNANYLLLWTAIQYAKTEANCTVFNFGASPPNADSLINFKKSWGTETHYYTKKQRVPKIIYPLYKLRQVLRG